MSELRRDPLTGRWVIIASHRNARPNEFASPPPRPSARLKCPFCAGNEAETPPEIARYPADAGRWSVRVVPNKYPALSPPEAGQVPVAGLLHSRAGEGAHEVIIESPRHVASLTELSRDEMRLAVRVYRDRLRRMRDDGRWRYALVFKNVGALAGASLHHIHSQLLATDLIPPEIQDKLQRIRRFAGRHGRGLFPVMLREETAQGRRLVLPGEVATAYCPYASRFPYEVRIVGTGDTPRFETLSDREVDQVADLTRHVLGGLERVLDEPAYNLVIHTAPFDSRRHDHYHWHIEILPRTTRAAGFELGAGCFINPLPPEEAAKRLQSAIKEAPAGDSQDRRNGNRC